MANKIRSTEYVPFSPPCIGDEEIAEVLDTLRSDWLTTGPKTKAFEEQFADAVGAEAGLALNSCTAGLHLALLGSGVRSGHEVITTPMTFAATVNVIEHVGARPVLVDVEPDTLNIDPNRVEAAITPRTRAITAVHFAGHPADMKSLREIAARHDLSLIEDAAHALPAKFDGRFVGGDSNYASFSFYATKNMTTGEGGMLTGSRELVDRVRPFALHGISRDAWNRYGPGGSWAYDIVTPGFKYNMTDIQASLGKWQLRKLGAFHKRRQQIAQAYNEAFADFDEFELPAQRGEVEHAWHLYVLRIRQQASSLTRDKLMSRLAENKIGASVHFIPSHVHSYSREKYGFAPRDFPIAISNYQRALSLPLSPRLTDSQVERVIDVVRGAVRQTQRRAA